MTKPDMLTSGATQAQRLWLDILEGRSNHLTRGYYCVCRPDDLDRANGTTFEQAQENERRFFEHTAPWAQSLHRARFGIPNLVDTLGTLLAHIIEEE